MSPIDPGQVAALAGIAFLGALVFGVTGFGSALVAIPLATHLVPLPFALALFALSDLVCAVSVGLENPRNAVRAEWTRLVPMILVGTAFGVTLLVNLPRAAGMLLLGLFIFSFSIYSLVGKASTKPINAAWAWLAGLAGGITSTLFGAGGPPYVIYLSQRGLAKEQFRATLGLTTMTSISLRVIAFLLTGLLLDARVWLTAAAVVPAALAALFLARKIFLRINRDQLMRAIALLLAASGVSLAARALTQM
ncbi:MAG TPA: sulfite exporter TauE/SafE family protein [Burkholderiales bacterium]